MVSVMLGMVGASGTFGAVCFVTPELFPTNMITQASGLSSFMGRLGGMLAPFITDLEKEISDHTVGLCNECVQEKEVSKKSDSFQGSETVLMDLAERTVNE